MPKVREEGYRVIQGDCLEILPTLPKHTFAACITDPPYGTTEEGISKVIKRSSQFEQFSEEWDKELPLKWLAEINRVVVPGGVIIAFTDGKRSGDLWDEFNLVGIKPLQLFFWVKDNPPPNPRQNFASAVEVAVFGRTEGKIHYWGGTGWTRNVFNCPIVTTNRLHRTQKPLALMKHLVELLCPVGEAVIDPFCGSATTGEACIESGRYFLGIEQDRESYKVAQRRLHRPTPIQDNDNFKPKQLRRN